MNLIKSSKTKIEKKTHRKFILIFIPSYFFFLIIFYILPRNYEIPIVLLIGFAVIIIEFFLFYHKRYNRIGGEVFKFKIFSENSFKFFIVIMMSITFFIPPADSFKTIIDWDQIEIANYFRAIIFLIGGGFLPGACLYNLFFSNNSLPKRLKIEPFFLKMTIYPILSFTFLGFFTLLIDKSGLEREYFSIVLFLAFILLFFSDLVKQKYKEKKILILKKTEISITKNTVIILIIAVGIIIISLGMQLSLQYLKVGDSWSGISSAKYVGTETSPIDKHYTYAIYWGYISFALSVLSGIPYININVLLCFFTFLSVFSIYLFMKSILRSFHNKYSVLSTIFVLTFSAFFYFFNENIGVINFEWKSIPLMTYNLILQFTYKTFSFIVFIFAMTIFINICNNISNTNKSFRYLYKSGKFKIFALCAFFLIQSYILYYYSLIVAIPLLLLYSIFSYNNKQSLRYFLFLMYILFIFFIIFDIMMNFLLTNIPLSFASTFLGSTFYLTWRGIEFASFIGIIVWSVIGGILFLSTMIYYLYNKFAPQKRKTQQKTTQNKRSKPLILFYIFFTFILICTIVILLSDILFFIINLNYVRETSFLNFYIKEVILKIGFVGISGLYLSYFCYKKNRKLFHFLTSWFIFFIVIASLPIFIMWAQFLDFQRIPTDVYSNMMYLFNRLWFYSIFPLSILSSIGLLNLKYKIKKKRLTKFKKIKNNSETKFEKIKLKLKLKIKPRIAQKIKPIFKKKRNLVLSKKIPAYIIIFFSFTNLIIVGMWGANIDNIDDSEANVIGWVSENIPANSNILVDSNGFYRTLYFMGGSHDFFVNEVYDEAIENAKNKFWYTKWSNDINSYISVLYELNGHNKIIKFDDQSDMGNTELHTKLDIPQKNGTLTFWIMTNETSSTSRKKYFNLYLIGNGGYLVNFQIINSSFYYYTDDYLEIYELQEDTWYNISLDFECSTGGYNGLNQFNWRLIINESIFNNLIFRDNSTQLDEIYLLTSYFHSDFSIYVDDLKFSWDPDYNIEDTFPVEIIINYLTQEDFKYLIITTKETYYKSRLPPLFYETVLIPNLFKEKLYEYKGVKVYFAPGV